MLRRYWLQLNSSSLKPRPLRRDEQSAVQTKGWAVARAPHMEAAESSRPEDLATPKNLPRDPLPKQDMT